MLHFLLRPEATENYTLANQMEEAAPRPQIPVTAPAQRHSVLLCVVGSLGLNMTPLSLRKPVDRGVQTEIGALIHFPRVRALVRTLLALPGSRLCVSLQCRARNWNLPLCPWLSEARGGTLSSGPGPAGTVWSQCEPNAKLVLSSWGLMESPLQGAGP